MIHPTLSCAPYNLRYGCSCLVRPLAAFTSSRPVTRATCSFCAPGILAQSILFLSIFYGIQIIWDRDMGIVHKCLASPTRRAALVLGRALSAGARALPQAAIIYVLALGLGVQMNWNPLAVLCVVMLVILAAACFSTFSLIIACLLKTRDRVMGIGQVLTMPLFFASSAIYPIAIMPGWLQVVARVNPLSYQVDALRLLMVTGSGSLNGLWIDVAVPPFGTPAPISLAGRPHSHDAPVRPLYHVG